MDEVDPVHKVHSVYDVHFASFILSLGAPVHLTLSGNLSPELLI